MSVKETIERRRAYRGLEKVIITKDLINDLATNAQLAASCFNYQPWNFVFVYDEKKLLEVFTTLKENNNWAKKASMIVAVFSKKELDCLIGLREYFLFDTGMAVGQMILRATELGLVMHPIAGFDDKGVRRLLGIPEEMIVITLLIVGKKSADLSTLTEYQTNMENTRPKRKALSEFIHFNNFGGK